MSAMPTTSRTLRAPGGVFDNLQKLAVGLTDIEL